MKIPRSFYNWLSITGFILAVNSLVLILIMFIISLTSGTGSTYVGLYTYIVLPAFLIIGLILIPIGMLVRVKKEVDGEITVQRWPYLDLNLKAHRSALLKVSVVTFLFLIASAMGSYQAFIYTESVDFCGKLCHKVMEPEHTTYLHSPHARVACVECHVGEGASWYVKSKMSGLYQVYSVLFHKYSQPIETPLVNLRPARETCEKCHWPQKFYARKLVSQLRFLPDSGNTEWTYSMLMKIGPTYSGQGLREGIHWHINPDVKIEYVSGSRDRESIPWVKYTNLKTGVVKIFQDESNKIAAKAMDTLEHRIVDCMDCHNRPSHLYRTPQVYIDNAMVAGTIPADLPYIKQTAMETLEKKWTDKDSAITYIKDNITKVYKENYPDVFGKRKSAIDKAIAGIIEAYSLNTFPYMRVDASRYLNHIGHKESDGCFRCHSGRHKTDKGETISKDCNLCHTIINQGPKGDIQSVTVNETMEFRHPADVGEDWKTELCSSCHRLSK